MTYSEAQLAKIKLHSVELFEALDMVNDMLHSGEMIRDLHFQGPPDFAKIAKDYVPKLNKIMMALHHAKGK